MSIADAKQMEIPYAFLENEAGNFADGQVANIQAAMDARASKFTERCLSNFLLSSIYYVCTLCICYQV